MRTSVAVVGATGKMGRLVSALIEESDDFEVVASLDSKSDPAELLAAELVVDFTLPDVSSSIVDLAVSNGRNALVGTSGWSKERVAELENRMTELQSAGRKVGGVIIVPNFSIGSVVATSLSTVAAAFFDSIEIVETHGQAKADSPSGTAVRTAELVAAARSGKTPIVAPNIDQPARGQTVSGISVHSRRLSGIVAAQEVLFGGMGETLSIRHDTYSPDSYRQGLLIGLRAARDASGITIGLDALIDVPAALKRVAAAAADATPDTAPAASPASRTSSGPAASSIADASS